MKLNYCRCFIKNSFSICKKNDTFFVLANKEKISIFYKDSLELYKEYERDY